MVVGLAEQVDELCERASAADSSVNGIVKVANFLFPSGFTCAGTKTAVDELCKLAVAARALQARLVKVGGAFHTELMRPAQDELSRALDAMSDRMRPPRCAVYFNVTGKRVPAGADPATFIELIKLQLTSEVLWEPTVKAMVMDGVKAPLRRMREGRCESSTSVVGEDSGTHPYA